MLNSVKDVSTSSSKQVATLEFVSVEAIINETARVNKKYTGNVTQTVKELLKTDTKGIQTSKKGSYKKAVVKISEGDRIDFFANL